jgi:hypothetical protein
MPMEMHLESANVYRLELRGVLRKVELDKCLDALAAELPGIGSVKLLFVLIGFEGWQSGDNWGDLTFYVAHGDAIERIAIVGPERWRGEALMFASAGLRKAPVMYFIPAATADARAWLAA